MVWVRHSFLVLAMSGMVFAGCSSKSETSSTETLGVDVVATSDTGVIRGVVVDAAVRPLAGVEVSVKTAEKTLNQNTTATGGFGFQGLKEGTYFVNAHKVGYNPVQTSVDVKAGVNEPGVVKISLAIDSSYVKPYFTAVAIDGFVECGTSLVAVCGAPNIIAQAECEGQFDPVPAACVGNTTNDKFGFNIFYDPNATMIQSEMSWDSTQAASPELTMQMENIDGCPVPSDTYVKNSSGASPIFTKVTKADIEKVGFGGGCPIFHSVFSGDVQGTPAGGTVQQPFTIYSHAFYGFSAPEGWRFSVDGDPVPPK